MRCLPLLALAIPFLALCLPAQRIYVDASAPPGGNGSTWATAYDDLGIALTNASSGSVLWVASGTYNGGFVVPSGVQMWGGFAGTETAPSQRAWPRATGSPSILDGADTQRVLEVGSGCTVDGFVVRNGNAGSPGGGGVLCNGTDPILRRLVLTGNRINDGRGHTVCVRAGADPLIAQCLVFDNNGPIGHCIDVENALGTFDHLTIFRNSENGIHLQDGAHARITNCIVARAGGRGICDVAFGAPNNPTVQNNLFWANRVSAMHYRGNELNVAQVNALSYASSNVGADPLFLSETPPDLRPSATSPAIDAGIGSPYGAFDFALGPRLLDGDLDGAIAPDIGAYELGHVALSVTGTVVGGGTFTLGASGPPGAFLLIGVSSYDPIGTGIPPLGSLHLGLPGLVITGLLPAPVQLPVPVPAGFPPGTSFAFQAAGLVGGAGNLSRSLHLLIR